LLPAIAFTGFHNAGKTTLVRRVVTTLRARGYRIGVVKSTKERDLVQEPPGKDTALYRGDGVEDVVLLEPGRAVCFREDAPSLEAVVFDLLGRCHLVVCEGFKGSSLPKIEVVADSSALSRLGERKNLLAVVWREPVEGFRTFGPHQIEELADFIEETFLGEGWAALWVNGRPVAMKPFVERTVATTVAALVGNLKGGEGARTVELKIRLPGEG